MIVLNGSTVWSFNDFLEKSSYSFLFALEDLIPSIIGKLKSTHPNIGAATTKKTAPETGFIKKGIINIGTDRIGITICDKSTKYKKFLAVLNSTSSIKL